MGIIINAACLNGCRSAQNHQHGCYLRDQLSVFRFILITVIVLALPALAEDGAIERVSIGEISDFSGESQIVHSSESYSDGMQVGGKVYPGDILTTASGNIEITFGINSRIRLGSNTELKIVSLVQESKSNSDINYYTSTYNLLLKSGILRVRVRENFITSTIISLVAGDIKVVAPRSDFLFSRIPGMGTSQRNIGILVAWGRIVANKKNVNDGEWNPNMEKTAEAGFTAVIPENDVADEVIKWEKIMPSQAVDSVMELPFSVDINNNIIDDVVESRPELQGA